MAEAVVSLTLETLRDLLLEEARFLSGVGDQVREIQGQLEMMKSFLKDADRKQHTDETIRTWIQQVRRLAYRTEDVLETHGVEIASKRGIRGVRKVIRRFACILSEGVALHKVGKEIADIKSEMADLKTSREAYGIKNLNGESSEKENEKHRLLRQTYAHDVEEHFVGMKDDIKTLVSLITDSERDHRVISIWGMGGLGKTTLAKKIFNHGVIQRSFEAFAWVCITQRSQIYEVLQDILKQIVGEDTQGDQPALVRDLHKVLAEKKCLVVLDDIWRQDDWEILRPAFPTTNTSSKVLLTTRSREVAKKGFLHKLSTLTEEESWELLQAKALTKRQDLTPESSFEHVGKEIVRKCDYLPLAVSVLGGILRDKSSVMEWKSVNEDIELYLGRGECQEEADGSVANVLALSYNELPYYLKPCFLYMGNFQEDEIIWAEKLYQLWIAEGLVLSKHRRKDESMMDVAERYLDELASRCMVEVKKDNMLSIAPRWVSCQLHDLMREVCLAKGKEEEFLKVIDIHGQHLPMMGLSSLPNNERRFGTHIYVKSRQTEEIFTRVIEQLKVQSLRALFVHYMDHGRLDLWDISGVKKLKLLKVLRLENCRFELPAEIDQLIYLRYLSLNNSEVSELPVSISNLPYLETLDLRTGLEVDIYLPNIFWKMKRLKHIYLPCHYSRRSVNLQFKDLSELEILYNYQSPRETQNDLSGLVNLRYFSGTLDSHNSFQIIDPICSLGKIKWVKFEVIGSNFMSDEGSTLLRKVFLCENLNELDIVQSPIHKFPPYEPQFCLNLTRLALFETKFEDDPMQFLSKLPELRILVFDSDAFMGKEMVCNLMAFPQLRYLAMYRLQNLEKWRVDEGAMCNLCYLEIGLCLRLKTITDGLNFSALRRFDIWGMPNEFKQKYKMLHEQERKKLEMVDHC